MMNKFLIEFNNAEITKLGVEAIIDFYYTMAIDELQLPGLHAFATGVDSSSLNVVIDTRENATFDADLIKSIDNFFKKFNIPWGWFITASVTESDIEKHDFSLSYESPGMYFDLSTHFSENKNNIVIKEEGGDLHEWIWPAQEGFPSDDNGEAYRKLNSELLAKKEIKLTHFTAYYKNEAAASATLFLSENSVMLHNLATRNKFKNLGIGSSLVLYMMSKARKLGYKHCFLDSSDEAFNLYKRLGFKVYCMTSVYEKLKSSPS